jgi:hypothetical protein
VELIVSTIATESRGNPTAERTEPGFISYEERLHRVSLGLTQTLISTARQALKDKSINAEALRDPRRHGLYRAAGEGDRFLSAQSRLRLQRRLPFPPDGRLEPLADAPVRPLRRLVQRLLHLLR